MSTLFKSERQHLRHIYCSTGRQFSCKNSPLVICPRLSLFVNTMTAVDKCPLPNGDNLRQPIHKELSQKLKSFSQFFRAFSKSGLNFEHFEKKDDPHSLFISEATTCKIVVSYMCKKSRFRLPFQKEHGKLVSTLFKFERQHLYHIYCSTGRELSCKKSLLVIWESLRRFVNTMSAVDKCSLPNRDNSMQPILMELSQKLKTFSWFFLHFGNLG